jgi:hypothetical protein
VTRPRGFGGGERCRKARRALVPGILVLCVARLAFGEEGAPSRREEVSEAERGEARALFHEGVAELDVGRYAEALACFQRAYVLWDSPKILLNIATTLRALGQNAQAATAYARYLETVAPDDPRRGEVTQALQDVRAQLGRIVSSNLQGVARLWIDDVEMAAVAGREVWVQPGGHTLVAERTSGSRQTLRIRVAAGGVQSVDWTPPSPPRPSGPRRPSPVTDSKFRALVRADFELTRGGALGAGGLAFDAREWLRVTGGALIGAQKGAWLGFESAPFGGRVRPVLGTSLPVFFVGPMYPGVSGELGVRFVATARIALFTRAAVAHFPTVPSGYVKTLYVPSAGLEVGL